MFVAATTSAMIGAAWDISWHKSIGRDTFWTPAHVLIYLCGILAGFGALALVIRNTWGPTRQRYSTVKVWGVRGPLGGFLCAWGAGAMLVSAPFDDWWHNAYGLDVKVLSPPHVVLILGILAIRFGVLLLVLGELNRAAGPLRERLEWLLLYMGSILLGGSLGAFLEWTTRNHMHSARFYLIVGFVATLMLSAVARVAAHPWAMTLMTALYTGVMLLFLWILPLFPAEPLLGPVYHPVTHFIPNDFPLLVIFPALALDLLRQRTAHWPAWKSALAGGPLFVAVLLAVQWPFAVFLQSPASRNWFFGAHYIPFFVPPASDYARHTFTLDEPSAREFWWTLLAAFGFAAAAARAGTGWGNWMRRVKR